MQQRHVVKWHAGRCIGGPHQNASSNTITSIPNKIWSQNTSSEYGSLLWDIPISDCVSPQKKSRCKSCIRRNLLDCVYPNIEPNQTEIEMTWKSTKHNRTFKWFEESTWHRIRDPPGTTATNHTSLNDFAADLGRPSERDQFHPCALGTDFKNPSMIPSALTKNDGTFRKVNMKVPNNMYPHEFGTLWGSGSSQYTWR